MHRLLLAGLIPAAFLVQSPALGQGAGPELACAYDALPPAQRRAVAVDFSSGTDAGRARVAAALTPMLDACSARFGWDDGRRRWAGDYAGQRAELEARAAALPAAVPAERLRAIFDAMSEADRKGMGTPANDAQFRAIGMRLQARFNEAGISRPHQAPAAGYVLALANLREIEAAWAALQG